MTTPNLSPADTIAAPVVSSAADAEPFRFGWRFVERTRADGTTELAQIPLSLEDLLHPQEGDFAVQTEIHIRECFHLFGVCGTRVPRLDRGHVFCDHVIQWGIPELRTLGPDVVVFEGLTHPFDPVHSGTFHVADHRAHCRLVVEIVSPDSRTNDIDRKPELYHRAGVQQYVIVDQQREGGPRQIINRRWTRDGFVIENADADGRVHLDAVGLVIFLRDNRLVIVDADTGNEIGEYVDEYAKGVAAREETEKARKAQQRAERKAKRETEKAKRETEKAKREAEARERAEARVRELEEELRRRPEPPA